MNYEIEFEQPKKVRVRKVQNSQEHINAALEEMEKEYLYPKHIECDGQNVTIYFI